MPHLSKRAISSFLRSECLRRLKFDLSPDTSTYQHERAAQNMPPRTVARPGLYALTAAGQEWEEAKVNDLVQAFGPGAVPGSRKTRPPSGPVPQKITFLIMILKEPYLLGFAKTPGRRISSG